MGEEGATELRNELTQKELQALSDLHKLCDHYDLRIESTYDRDGRACLMISVGSSLMSLLVKKISKDGMQVYMS